MKFNLYIFSDRGVAKIFCEGEKRLGETIDMMARFGHKKTDMIWLEGA